MLHYLHCAFFEKHENNSFSLEKYQLLHFTIDIAAWSE